MRSRNRSRWLTIAGGLCLAGPLGAQPPRPVETAPPPVAAPRAAEALPPIGNDFPLWLRSTDAVVEGENSRGEERRERRGEGEIETDRDSFTPATTTAGRGRLIVESAYSFIDNRRVKETHSYPELLFRLGVTERIELRLGWNYEVGGSGNQVSSSGGGATDERGELERESEISYGAKFLMSYQDGCRPASAFILQGTTPTSGRDTTTQLIATSVWGWELPNRWKFDAAYRYATASERGDRFDVLAPSAVLKVPVGEKWAAHAEYFGLFSRDKEHDFVKHFISPGVHYLVTPNFEVGVRVGWGLNDQSARFFTNAGIGWLY